MRRIDLIQAIITDLQNGLADIQTDNEGQLVLYTGYYVQVNPVHPDFEIEETADPDFSS